MREQSRARITAAALELFAQRGFEATSLSAVTRAAGVSQGLASYYFSTKRDLLASVFAAWLDQICGLMISAGEEEDPERGLARLIDGVLTGAGANLSVTRLMLALMVQPSARSVFAEVETASAERVAAAEAAVESLFAARGAEDPALEHVMFRSVLEGVTFKLAVYEDTYPLEDARRHLYRLYRLPEPQPLFAERTGPIRLRAARPEA
ncbi:TetR/AcrR family transcriptional regulator [Streptomyces hoynatensis]|uniref:TetR/AcrR family transcriptional regulator n=2 Tax=Streptomyces hoynatensis TaxID=1141874 RepID=A0A3A9YSN2_9ACTN|nr:TetR/AcrR family transcriptional regulator [Streptomyces hoynatensis]